MTHFVELSNGSRWHLGEPDQKIPLDVLAHSLSNLCRFTGHAKAYYSVAEHCVRVSMIEQTLGALLHDAHEAITNDLNTPLRSYIAEGTAGAEQHCEYASVAGEVQLAIARQYGIAYTADPAIKRADQIMLLIEAFDLLPSRGYGWGLPGDIVQEARELYIMRPELRVACWNPPHAAIEFAQRFTELDTGATADYHGEDADEYSDDLAN